MIAPVRVVRSLVRAWPTIRWTMRRCECEAVLSHHLSIVERERGRCSVQTARTTVLAGPPGALCVAFLGAGRFRLSAYLR